MGCLIMDESYTLRPSRIPRPEIELIRNSQPPIYLRLPYNDMREGDGFTIDKDRLGINGLTSIINEAARLGISLLYMQYPHKTDFWVASLSAKKQPHSTIDVLCHIGDEWVSFANLLRTAKLPRKLLFNIVQQLILSDQIEARKSVMTNRGGRPSREFRKKIKNGEVFKPLSDDMEYPQPIKVTPIQSRFMRDP